MKKSIVYIEFILLLIAFSCCFIPCLVYNKDMLINIYVFDANKIMGYLYMIILIIGIVLKLLVFLNKTKFKKSVTNYINNYGAITLMLVSFVLYLLSCLYRKNILLPFGLGFYILTVATILMILLFITKLFIYKKNRK